jgi:hypothetical protein
VRNRGWKIWPTKNLTHARRAVLHAVNVRHGTGGFTSPLKGVRATNFSLHILYFIDLQINVTLTHTIKFM